MKDILSAHSATVLATFAWSNVLLGFDYDGTLAPIVTDPRRARMRPKTRRLLNKVARRYPCVVLSGRARNDLTKRLGRIPLWSIFGNHGLEPWERNCASAATVRDWVARLRPRLQGHPGVIVEDKKYSVAIHYRRARKKAAARRAIAVAVRGLRNARVIGGEQAVNVLLRDAPDKGVALQRARAVLWCETVIYVGDDDTDEAAFASAPSDRLLAVRIGRRRSSSHASYRLKAQAAIDQLLEALLALRTKSSAEMASAPPRRRHTVHLFIPRNPARSDGNSITSRAGRVLRPRTGVR